MNPVQALEQKSQEEKFQTVIIGGGQAGLALGYFLAQRQEKFIILDQNAHTGDVWRCRWDSLRLFTPSQFDRLPGMPFPGPVDFYPTKDEVADYLETYARRFELPVRHNTRVEQLSRVGNEYKIQAGQESLMARNVVIATGAFHRPYTPPIAEQLAPATLQLHSSDYRNPSQIPQAAVLVVGAANSGAEIALELAKAGKQVWLSGRDVGRLPSNSPLGKLFQGRLLWWFMNHVLTMDTPIGRRLKSGSEGHGTPLGRALRGEIAAAGVRLVPRLAGIPGGTPQLEDGQVIPAQAVLWATGYQPDYAWIALPILNEQGYPLHSRGVVKGYPGLYFLGLPFQTRLSSPLLGGVGKDAAEIAAHIS